MDTLASLMEVKLDIREKRTEIPLRTWTRCYIKIEAIKSFPCYLKITFHKNVLQIEPGLVLRINIPGLEIYPVKSRTKPYVYGLYWKQNRKQCIAFLSLDSKLSMDAHMKWVEWQIQNLEQYRKEILQTSRFSRMTQSFIETEDSGIYQNMGDESCRINRDMNDVLGPLPNIPANTQESDKSWSRRMSGMSGIYEEIIDPCSRSRIAARESAIYEEMKLSNQLVASPPPLPPRQRKRLDTDCSNLQRSYTSPESDYLVNKKKWNIFDNMFGKGSKKSPVESRKKRNGEKIPLQSRELQLLKAKRNSFSSPDLTHLYSPTPAGDSSFNFSGCENCSFDQSNISSSNSYELENVCEEDDDDDDLSAAIENGINISQQIRPNFEPLSNNDMSRVNLVGSGYNLDESSTSPMSPPGYLEMRPGKGFDMRKVEELDRQVQIQNDILYRLKYSFDSPITYKREFDYDSPSPVKRSSTQTECHYVPMNVGTKFSPKFQPSSISVEEQTYVPMNRCIVAPSLIVQPSSSVQISNGTQVCNNGSPSMSSSLPPCENDSGVVRNKRRSVEDKIASYYPNYDVPMRVKCTSSHVRSQTTESDVVVNGCKSKTPEPESRTSAAIVTIRDEREKTCSVPIPLRKTKRFGSFNTKSHSLSDGNNNDGEISRKYATIARITAPSKYRCSDEDLTKFNLSPSIGNAKVKSGSVSPNSIKRFPSLSKLKKLDFSPLRLKITSVLQRHNSGSC